MVLVAQGLNGFSQMVQGLFRGGLGFIQGWFRAFRVYLYRFGK